MGKPPYNDDEPSIAKANDEGHFVNSERAIAYRKQASALIQALLNEELSARAILNCWPLLGNEDPSVRCAYTMIWYFEADEDRHKTELFYTDVQIQHLMEVQRFLQTGQVLPEALLQVYQPGIAPPECHGQWTWRQPWWWLKTQWGMLKSIVETNPRIAALNSRYNDEKHKRKRPRYNAGAFRYKF